MREIVKRAASSLTEPLLCIDKLSSVGCMPDRMKSAKIIPVYRKGEPYLPGFYRPFSLLSMFDNLLEKFMSAWKYKLVKEKKSLLILVLIQN